MIFLDFLLKALRFSLVYGWRDNDGGPRGDLGPDPPHEGDTK